MTHYLENKKILVVDDEEQMLFVLKRALSVFVDKYKMDILLSISGVEGLEILKKHNKDIVLVISDMRMPEMSGKKFLTKVKHLYPEILLIALTAYPDIHDTIQLINLGVNAYILKPWDIKYLLTMVKRTLNQYVIQQERNEYFKRLNYELEWAGELQKKLLERNLPQNDNISFNISYDPLSDLKAGGDYYDVFELDESAYLVIIGDVAGHGLRGAFITAILKSLIYKEYVKDNKTNFILSHFFGWLNNRLQEELANVSSILVTFSAVLIDLNNEKLSYANAGHPPSFVIREKQIFELTAQGLAFGFKGKNKYEVKEFDIKKDDKIVLYTDGLVELRTEKTKDIVENIELFKEVLLNNINKSDYNKSVIEELKSHCINKKYDDDITLISIDIK